MFDSSRAWWRTGDHHSDCQSLRATNHSGSKPIVCQCVFVHKMPRTDSRLCQTNRSPRQSDQTPVILIKPFTGCRDLQNGQDRDYVWLVPEVGLEPTCP